MGKEPVVVDGRTVGLRHQCRVRLHRSARSIAYAWVPAAVATAGTAVEVVSFGMPLGATVADDPLFDPRMERLRS